MPRSWEVRTRDLLALLAVQTEQTPQMHNASRNVSVVTVRFNSIVGASMSRTAYRVMIHPALQREYSGDRDVKALQASSAIYIMGRGHEARASEYIEPRKAVACLNCTK